MHYKIVCYHSRHDYYSVINEQCQEHDCLQLEYEMNELCASGISIGLNERNGGIKYRLECT